MTIRVAVASSDGKVVNQHFGAASQFLIFDVDARHFSLVETREATRACHSGAHDEDKLLQSVKHLADCKLVLISRVGPGAQALLKAHGIDCYECGLFIDEALQRLQTSPYVQKTYLSKEGV